MASGVIFEYKEGVLQITHSVIEAVEAPGVKFYCLTATFRAKETGMEYYTRLDNAGIRGLGPLLSGAPELMRFMTVNMPKLEFVGTDSLVVHCSMVIEADKVGETLKYVADLVLKSMPPVSREVAELKKQIDALRQELAATNARMAEMVSATEKAYTEKMRKIRAEMDEVIKLHE